jgi:hypothetical protein
MMSVRSPSHNELPLPSAGKVRHDTWMLLKLVETVVAADVDTEDEE